MKWLLAIIVVCSLVQATSSFLVLLQLGRLLEIKERELEDDHSP
jgi:hypothetical protein